MESSIEEMNLISLAFIVFLGICIILYFVMPLKMRWTVLLAGSCIFYVLGSSVGILVIALATILTYSCALIMDRLYDKSEIAAVRDADSAFWGKVSETGFTERDARLETERNKALKQARQKAYARTKRKTRPVLFLGITLLLAFLIYTKAGTRIMELASGILQGQVLSIPAIVPLGISYYTFAAIGYLADVYWKKDNAEKNPFKLLLFLMYFPHITQGPIPRHNRLARQLYEGHRFDYQRVCFGLQRMVWGYFKKMVIADRFSVIVGEVFQNYDKYEGLIFIVAAMASAIQLYADFSGCMDIAIGISEVFGITLEENFKRPFFSRCASEFWRRWHITLGAWFKDYVYMPLVVSPTLIRLSNICKNIFGKRFAKNLLTVIPLAVVWFLTGVWHGTGMNYIAWGAWWGGIIILSTVFSPELKKLTQVLKIDTESGYWTVFQMVRTFIIFSFGRLLTVPGDLEASRNILFRIIGRWNPWIFFDGTLYKLGLDQPDFWVGIVSALLLWYIEIQQEKGIVIRKKLSAAPIVIRWATYYAVFFAVLILGVYGAGHTVGFIYANF